MVRSHAMLCATLLLVEIILAGLLASRTDEEPLASMFILLTGVWELVHVDTQNVLLCT